MNLKNYTIAAFTALTLAACAGKPAPPVQKPKEVPQIPYGEMMNLITVYPFTPVNSADGKTIVNNRNSFTIDATYNNQNYRFVQPSMPQGYNAIAWDTLGKRPKGELKLRINRDCVREKLGKPVEKGEYTPPISMEWKGDNLVLTMPDGCLDFYVLERTGAIKFSSAQSVPLGP
ncbi:MAG TPA: hypothetical protein VI968_03320 [archaeon]|nr:hypothetical protein [archaeon]